MGYEVNVKKITRSKNYLVSGSRWLGKDYCFDIPEIGSYCQLSQGVFAGNVADIMEIREEERQPSYKGGIAYCLAVRRGAVFRKFNNIKVPLYVLVWYISMVDIANIVKGLDLKRMPNDLAAFDEVYNSTGFYSMETGIIGI